MTKARILLVADERTESTPHTPPGMSGCRCDVTVYDASKSVVGTAEPATAMPDMPPGAKCVSVISARTSGSTAWPTAARSGRETSPMGDAPSAELFRLSTARKAPFSRETHGTTVLDDTSDLAALVSRQSLFGLSMLM